MKRSSVSGQYKPKQRHDQRVGFLALVLNVSCIEHDGVDGGDGVDTALAESSLVGVMCSVGLCSQR